MRQFFFDGEYRQFRGYVFFARKPVVVYDDATIAAILRDNSFKEVQHEEVKEAAEAEVLSAPVPDACPKCGKVVRQGKYMHQKYCRG